MPYLQHTYYQYDDFGHSETFIFSNSLGTNLSMWTAQADALQAYFNILRYDTRGHGQSLFPKGEKLTIADLGQDVVNLLDHLGLSQVHFCGLSMGGLIGQWLGINHSQRFKTITLANTAAKIGTQEAWEARIAQVSAQGLSSITAATAERWFTTTFRATQPQVVQNILNDFVVTSQQGYLACCGVVRDCDFRDTLSALTVPTLVITGDQDPVTTVEQGQWMADKIPTSKLAILSAAHLSSVEQAGAFSELLIGQAKF